MTIELNNTQAQILIAMLDIAVKNMGVRAMEDDVVSIFQAVKKSFAQAAEDAQAGEDLV
jgi:hypothetical protein